MLVEFNPHSFDTRFVSITFHETSRMNKIILVVIFGLFSNVVHAVDVVGQQYIDGLARSGSIGITRVAQDIYNTREQDVEVLDVAAEVLLSRYLSARGGRDINAMAWLCRAIGGSGNARYHDALKEVVDSRVHKKLRKHAKKALKKVGKPQGEQYVKGTIDLAALRESALGSVEQVENTSTGTQGGTAKQKINVVREGMSVNQVRDLIGSQRILLPMRQGKVSILSTSANPTSAVPFFYTNGRVA